MSGPSRLLQSSPNVLKTPSAAGGIRCRLSSPAAGSTTRSSKPTSSPTSKPLTTLQEANPRNLPEVWFGSTFPRSNNAPNNTFFQPSQPSPSKGPDDPNKVKLGKTLRILQSRLPTLLNSPLPQEILSPSISLHLFPSTHPHLPAVRGRVAYQAALWTSPIAWNRVPGLGNVRLEILSERMVRDKPARRSGAADDKLVVRWRTIGGSSRSLVGLLLKNGRGGAVEDNDGSGPMAPGRGEVVGASQRPGEGREFTGLFIFEFDKEGRILSHTIEHVEEGGQWERGVGAKVVGLTDWLLGGFKNNGEGSSTPSPAFSSNSKGR